MKEELPELTPEEIEAAIHEGRKAKFFRLKAEARGNNELKAGLDRNLNIITAKYSLAESAFNHLNAVSDGKINKNGV